MENNVEPRYNIAYMRSDKGVKRIAAPVGKSDEDVLAGVYGSVDEAAADLFKSRYYVDTAKEMRFDKLLILKTQRGRHTQIEAEFNIAELERRVEVLENV